MTGTWNHDRPYYRCQAQRDLVIAERDHPTRMYVREDKIVPHLDTWMAKLFDDENIDNTCQILAEATQPDKEREAQRQSIKDRIRQLDKELEKYRAVIQAEPESSPVVGKWIAEAHQERRRLETILGVKPTSTVTPEDIKALLASLKDIAATLANADPKDKAEAYAEMGLELTYHSDGQLILEAMPRRLRSGVGERTRTSTGL